MTDHLSKMRARQAARDYMQGEGVKREASQLSQPMLASKFEVSAHAISRAVSNMPTEALTAEESKLVRECYSEHVRLTTAASRLTLPYLAKHHRVQVADIQVELELAGYESPRRKAKKGAAA